MLDPPSAGDELLVRWEKQQTPLLPLPPPGLGLTGWRDPFVLQPGAATLPASLFVVPVGAPEHLAQDGDGWAGTQTHHEASFGMLYH